MSDWTEQVAGARMQVDQRFQDRVRNSGFTNQEWGLIMTAVDFEIQYADDPDRAQIVAETSKLEDIVPELERIQDQMGGAPMAVDDAPDRSGIGGTVRGLLDSLTPDRSTGTDRERLDDARDLTQGYANELQSFLKERGRWEQIREMAAEEGTDHATGPDGTE